MSTRCPIILVAALLLAGCVSDGRPKGDLQPFADLTTDEVQQGLRPRRLALVVGIGTFEDDRWPRLKHAVNDARQLATVFEDPELGRFDRVVLLADPRGTELEDIKVALERLAEDNTSERDTVVIYFSTHGTLARGPRGRLARYLVTRGTRKDNIRQTALRVGELTGRFEQMASRRKVLILASCHSGSGKSALPDDLANELEGIKGAFFVRPVEEISQASMVLAACAWGETAREDDGLEHDIYTNFLLEALSGGDEDGDGAVTATEAHAHAMARTYYFSRGRQRPQVESSVLGSDPIVLSGRRTRPADPVLFSFLTHFEGMRVSVDGRDKGQLPTRLVLEPGRHHLVVSDEQDGEPLIDREIDLAVGDRVSVQQLVEEQRPDWHLTALGGYQWFLDADIRASMVAPAPVGGLSFSRLDFPMRGFEVGIDLALGGGEQSLSAGGLAFEQDLVEIGYGLKLLYRFDLDPVHLLVGPRLAIVHLLRRNLSPGGIDQNYMNFSPGLVLGVRWMIWARLSLDVEARVHFFSVHTDEESLDLGYLDLFGGLGWSF